MGTIDRQWDQLDWDDVRVFLAVAEAGSYRRAAQKLGLGHTTLSRRIERLEADLQIRLFNRLPSGLTLTSAGAEVSEAARGIATEFSELAVRLFGQDTEPRGVVKFTVPAMFLSHALIGPLVAFRARWPEIQVEILHSLDLLDLRAKEADLALRMTNSPLEELVGRKVGVFCEAAYATETYLEQHQTGEPHTWFDPGAGYSFGGRLVAAHRGSLEPVLNLYDPELQLAAAVQSLGVATLPCLMGEREPNLRRISNVVKRSDIWLLSHRDAVGNRRMQLFREFLVTEMERIQPFLEGKAA